MLLFDEMKVKAGLIFSRSTGKLIGFVELGKFSISVPVKQYEMLLFCLQYKSQLLQILLVICHICPNYAFLYITFENLYRYGQVNILLSMPGRQNIVKFKNRNKLNSWNPKFKTPKEMPTLPHLNLKKMFQLRSF